MLQPTNATVQPAGPTADAAPAREAQENRSTKEVIDNHLGYFGERNLAIELANELEQRRGR